MQRCPETAGLVLPSEASARRAIPPHRGRRSHSHSIAARPLDETLIPATAEPCLREPLNDCPFVSQHEVRNSLFSLELSPVPKSRWMSTGIQPNISCGASLDNRRQERSSWCSNRTARRAAVRRGQDDHRVSTVIEMDGEVNHRPGARFSADRQTVLPTVRFSAATTLEFTPAANRPVHPQPGRQRYATLSAASRRFLSAEANQPQSRR